MKVFSKWSYIKLHVELFALKGLLDTIMTNNFFTYVVKETMSLQINMVT
jgi:hypothetical protein